jgi:hypothetical protein
MDWKTFSVELLSAVVWPATILVFGLLFRAPLSDLISRIRRIRHKDTELLVEELIQEPISGQEDARESVDSPDRQEDEDYHSFLRRLAKGAPNVAILEAWNIVQNEAQAAIARAPKEVKVYGIPPTERWLSSELLSRENFEKYRRLETVRNIISHGNNLHLSESAVESYIRMAIEVGYALRNYNRQS